MKDNWMEFSPAPITIEGNQRASSGVQQYLLEITLRDTHTTPSTNKRTHLVWCYDDG